MRINRREFFLASSAAALAGAAGPEKSQIGLIRSTHRGLRSPAPLDDPLNYTQVRDMVFRAISLGTPGAGSLEAKIKPGAWVVVKPNIVSLRPRPSYAPGDVTDFRVTQAVVEYVASRTRAGRITVAEGGSYRNLTDTARDNVFMQDGRRVDALTFDWGPDEFPGFNGSLGGILDRCARRYPEKKFDYVDLSYDAVRDPGGALRRIAVPASANGTGAFSDRPDYYVTNTITSCDFLITVPVMKVHLMCGITACLKNYVGTAPREAYSVPGVFSNQNLHSQHSCGGRIDPFIVDLAAFHPPDYCVVDGIRGLQSQEHANQRPDQTVRSNLILAGEDPVATDALIARLLGFQSNDIDYFHMAERRGMGTMDFSRIDVRGDEPDRDTRRWEKPSRWYGRCNRNWVLRTASGWKPHESRHDTLDLPKATGIPPADGARYLARVEVISEGHSRGYLWIGARGRLLARLNDEPVAQLEADTRYRVGQYQYPVTLAPGRNKLEFGSQPIGGEALLSVLLTGPRNDGDTAEGIRWQQA